MNTTIEQLIQLSESYDANKHDFAVQPSEAGFKDGQFTTNSNGFGKTVYQVEDYALNQVAGRLNIPVSYLKKCPPQVRDYNLNYWMWSQRDQRGQDKPWLVRTSSNNVRGFLSDVYRPIGNTEVLQIAQELLNSSPYKLIRPFVSRDDLHLRVCVLDGVGPDGNYGFGAYLGNGEIGNRSLTVAPYLMRTSCTNSTIWLDKAWEQRHAHVSTAYLRAGLKEKLGQAFKLADSMLEQVVKAEEDAIPDLRNVINDLAKKHRFTDEQRTLVYQGTENNRTRMGLINGLTWMAQRVDNPDEQVRYEALAGSILCDRGSFFGKAARAVAVEAEA